MPLPGAAPAALGNLTKATCDAVPKTYGHVTLDFMCYLVPRQKIAKIFIAVQGYYVVCNKELFLLMEEDAPSIPYFRLLLCLRNKGRVGG